MAYFWQQGPNCWGDWVSEMIHCYWLAHQQQCKSEEKERETLSDIWVSHHRQCSHLCGAEGVGSKNQPWASSAWPLLWLTWEWQDYAILQANSFSNQLSQHHIWWKMWFGLDFRWVSALAYSTDKSWLRFPPNTDEEVHSCWAPKGDVIHTYKKGENAKNERSFEKMITDLDNF